MTYKPQSPAGSAVSDTVHEVESWHLAVLCWNSKETHVASASHAAAHPATV